MIRQNYLFFGALSVPFLLQNKRDCLWNLSDIRDVYQNLRRRLSVL